jgi:hypothetical protein
MPGSPRDTGSILQSLETTTRALNPRMDTRKGAIATVYWAHSQELSRTEQFAAYLRSLYQLENAELVDQTDMEALARNFGNDPGKAKVSSGTVFFYRSSRPLAGTLYTVGSGWTVSTLDGRFNFRTTESVTMNGDAAAAYYNATTRRYEIPVKVEAVAAGQDYDLPPDTIRVVVTTQADFDGCVNRDYLKQGSSAPTKVQLRNNIWDRLQGLDRNATGAVLTILQDVDPVGYDSFTLVASSDFTTFRRHSTLLDKMGYDVYLISDAVDETTQTGVAQGGETSVVLDQRPAFSIVYVLVDGVQVPFALSLSTDPLLQGSSRGIDSVDLTVPLQPAQSYEIRYLYYSLIQQANVAVQGRTKPFGTDVLFRRANPTQIYIAGRVAAFSTMDATSVANDIQTFTTSYLRDPANPTASSIRQFVTLLDPSHYQRAVEQTVDGVAQFKLDHFAKLDVAAQDIEYITLDGKTEYPVLSVSSTFT